MRQLMTAMIVALVVAYLSEFDPDVTLFRLGLLTIIFIAVYLLGRFTIHAGGEGR